MVCEERVSKEIFNELQDVIIAEIREPKGTNVMTDENNEIPIEVVDTFDIESSKNDN